MEPINELELAPTTVILEAARQYAKAFTATRQYQAFVKAYNDFLEDETAQQTLFQLRQKHEQIRNQPLSEPVGETIQTEIKRLEEIFYAQPSVKAYLGAQNELIALAQTHGDVLSEALGLDFAAACQRRGGCCG